jgi:hypothetical protein
LEQRQHLAARVVLLGAQPQAEGRVGRCELEKAAQIALRLHGVATELGVEDGDAACAHGGYGQSWIAETERRDCNGAERSHVRSFRRGGLNGR